MGKIIGKRVFVGMSGGVDSSVAAYLLKKQGYDVTGVFMRCYNLDGCSEKDAEDARRVAEHLDIPFYVWDFEEEYKKKVVDYMVRGYKKGITPNPDVMCNREIKFGLFLERALKMGADYVATGHYVRLRWKHQAPSTKHRTGPGLKAQNTYELLQAEDQNKDQSYFLWTLTQKQLQHCLFPIGDYLKPKVREIARRAGLPTADKKDSQGICFLGMVSMDEFLDKYIPKRKGDVLDAKGKKIGEHIGAHFYTIGQRQGIGNIKHQKGNQTHKPVYVSRKDVRKNVVVVEEEGSPALYRSVARLSDLNIINPIGPKKDKRTKINVWARVRYRQPLAPAVLEKSQAPNSKYQTWKLVFKEPQKFVAEGQSAVFYLPVRSGTKGGDKNGLVMLGGGVIT